MNGTRLTAYKNKKVYDFTDWDLVPPPQSYFDEMVRISKHQIIWGADYAKWDGMGTGRIVWDKLVPIKMSFKTTETAYCSFIEDTWTIELLWTGMRQAKSLNEPTVQQGNKKLNEKRIHPCHKPILLYDAIYRRFAKPNMHVIDTHLGGGSNRISAYKNKLNFVGCEINPVYFADQEKRFSQFMSQIRMF